MKKKLKLENMKFFGLDQESFYEGEVINVKPHGHGKLTFSKVETNEYDPYFEGIFHEGLPIEGKFFNRFGTIFDGKFDKENSENGNGRIIYKDDGEYIGEWYRFEKIGEGMMKFIAGTEFKGRWHEDCPSDGVMTYPDGTKFKGWFNQLSYDFSDGEIIYPNGSKFKADFFYFDERVRRDFEGKMFYPNNGGVIEGTLHIADFIKFNDHLSNDTYMLTPSAKDRFEPKK